jgi:uncharacterized protein
MRPLITRQHWNGLELFSLSDRSLHFAWDPNRVSLAQISESWSEALASELRQWLDEPNDTRYASLDHLRTLTINVTQVCNLKCLYCAAGGDGTYGQAQKKIEIEKVIPQLKKLFQTSQFGARLRVTFSGGEPLLYPEGIEVISDYLLDEAKTHGIDLQLGIVTNGTLLNSSNLELLSRYKMDITVSLDGSPEFNRLQRPKTGDGDPTPQIEAGLNRLSHFRESLGTLVVSGVFNRNNLDIRDAYQYYSRWQFDLYDFNFDYFENDTEASHKFVSSVIDLAYEIFEKEGLEGLSKILFFKRVFDHLDLGIKLAHHCGAGQSYLAIDARGDAYACPWKIGDSKFKVDFSFDRTLYRSSHQPNCHECWARPICGGGCQFQHDSLGKEQIELFCHRMKSLLASAFSFYIKGRDYGQTTTFKQNISTHKTA